jgi:hypothetical protein
MSVPVKTALRIFVPIFCILLYVRMEMNQRNGTRLRMAAEPAAVTAAAAMPTTPHHTGVTDTVTMDAIMATLTLGVPAAAVAPAAATPVAAAAPALPAAMPPPMGAPAAALTAPAASMFDAAQYLEQNVDLTVVTATEDHWNMFGRHEGRLFPHIVAGLLKQQGWTVHAAMYLPNAPVSQPLTLSEAAAACTTTLECMGVTCRHSSSFDNCTTLTGRSHSTYCDLVQLNKSTSGEVACAPGAEYWHPTRTADHDQIMSTSAKSNKEFGLPPDFAPDVYRAIHDDLRRLTDKQAQGHYLQFGKAEGRIYRKDQIHSRNRAVQSRAYSSARGTFDAHGNYVGPLQDRAVGWQDVLEAQAATTMRPRRKIQPRDLGGEILFVVNTHNASRHDLTELCKDDRVLTCSNFGYGCQSLEQSHDGYRQTARKLAHCFRGVCQRHTNFSLVKMDDDVILNPHVRPGPDSACDVATRQINNLDHNDTYFVDGPKTLPVFKTRGSRFPRTAMCLGYFWYLNVEDTRSFCANLDLLTPYNAEDVSFTELFARLGFSMRDISHKYVGMERACFPVSKDGPVRNVQCEEFGPRGRDLFPRVTEK